MSTERDDRMFDSIIEEVKQLEKSIAEKDYELRIPPAVPILIAALME
jgi:hypothetical protein